MTDQTQIGETQRQGDDQLSFEFRARAARRFLGRFVTAMPIESRAHRAFRAHLVGVAEIIEAIEQRSIGDVSPGQVNDLLSEFFGRL
ncbi:MAG: hypothetical protein AAFV29_24945, partial [Myxococcota bacterium]